MDEEAAAENNSNHILHQDKRQISSYGISINTTDFQPVDTTTEDGNELEKLGINAYEQDQFESGIIHQVDTQIAEAEVNFQRNITKKEIANIETEIKNVEKEISDIENTFKLAKNGDPSYTRKISFSLLQRKQSKENYLKQLQKKLSETYSNLDDLNTTAKAPSSGQSNDRQEDLIKLGEITPFDALKLKQKWNNDVSIANKHSSSDIQRNVRTVNNVSNTISSTLAERVQLEPPGIEKEIDLEIEKELEEVVPTSSSSGIASKKRKKSTLESEDEYIPSKSSTDDEEYELEDLSEKPHAGKKKKKTAPPKTEPKKKCVKVEDDGDFKSFKERMRKLKVKKILKEACKNGEVQEEYNASDFSETTDEEDNEVTVEDDFVLDKKIWNKLYKYQRVGVKWLWQLHKQQVGGIIGDEMGLGKTIQIIAFLVGLMQRKENNTSVHRKKGLGAILIVCPATVLHQWVVEFHKWGPKFRVAILHDSGSFSGRKAALIKAINGHPGVLITTYAGVRLNKEELYRYYWNYVILDEGHKIRNPDSDVTLAVKQFDTPHRIILTGTPMQNSLKELWSLFDFVYPGRLGTLPVFMAEFSVPITMGGYANASAIQVQTAHRCATVLRDTINPYMMRRMKKDVKMIVELPQKSEQVLFCKLSEEQKSLYQEYINSTEVAAMLAGRMKIFPGLIKLRKICNHPDLVFLEQQTTASSDKDKGDKKKKDAEKKTVPQFQPSQYEYKGGYGFWERAGKMLVVESLLRMWKEKNHRVLLFTQSKQMLNILETFVQSVGYSYMRMDGETNIGSRQTMVKKFNEDANIFVFLLTTRVGGLGLNLIGADRIIIYDPDWNPSTDSQARERSWRIGQQKNVTIYRLMTTGTLEEKIYHRQIFKQFLTNRVLSNPFQRRFFKSNDLYELFSLDDIGPQQTTETGALFAGTGSEIKLRNKKRKRSKSIDGANVREDSDSHQNGAINPTGTVRSSNLNHLSQQTSQCNSSLNNGNSSLNTDANKSNSQKNDVLVKKDKKKKKKKKKKHNKPVQIDGTVVSHIEKVEAYKRSENELDADNGNVGTQLKDKESLKKKDENDILQSLFQSSGIHSALKHDRIEQAGNPDYVLVEKEAERVAKQAIKALKESRAKCRMNGFSVPTWTGSSNGSVGATPAAQPKKRRFGKSASNITATGQRFSNKDTSSRNETNSVATVFDLESESIDVSSSALLARMRCRNAAVTSTVLPQNGDDGSPKTSEESVLLKDIEQYMSCRSDGLATSDELTAFFKERLKVGQNALFKELLKQICTFEKKDGVGTWKLKSEFQS